MGDAACRKRFGDPDHTFDALLCALKTQAVPVWGEADPFTGERRNLSFDATDLGTVDAAVQFTPAEESALLHAGAG